VAGAVDGRRPQVGAAQIQPDGVFRHEAHDNRPWLVYGGWWIVAGGWWCSAGAHNPPITIVNVPNRNFLRAFWRWMCYKMEQSPLVCVDMY
jgi:hypothetical protein